MPYASLIFGKMELAKADLVGPGDWEMLAEYAASQTTLEQMCHPSPPVAPDLLRLLPLFAVLSSHH